jgi:ribonucleoside-diphosphate reductase subunit M1
MQYNSTVETSVCNSAAIILPKFFTDSGKYDFVALHKTTKHVVLDLDATLDHHYYPTPECRQSNIRHRPLGISVQGLADVFIIAKIPYDSAEARILNCRIFEVIYHAALDASCKLACAEGPHESWIGSPAEQGLLQFDLWNTVFSGRMDWSQLKTQIDEHGLRNSLLIASAPISSSMHWGDYNDSFAPHPRCVTHL